MKLLFDIGNTRAKCALYDGPSLVDTGVATPAYVHTLLRHYGHDIQCAVASVVGPEPDWQTLLPEGLPLHRLTARSPLPFSLDYQTPETLGADRLAALCGAYHRFGDDNLLVVDAGTCVTLDLLRDGVYRGGAIMPGIQMMLSAMHQHTARLPRLTYSGQPVPLRGQSTEECLLSGAVHGVASAIKIHSLLPEPPAQVILTGGDAEWLQPHLNKPHLCKNLLFEGLNSLKVES